MTAAHVNLRYSSELGKGLLLRSLTASVEGDDSVIKTYVESVSTWVRNPMMGGP